jgi:hypothetical protein
LKNVSDFDAAADVEFACAVRAGVAGHDVADIGDEPRLGQVESDIRAGEVIAFLVRASDEVRHRGDRMIGNDPDPALAPIGPI